MNRNQWWRKAGLLGALVVALGAGPATPTYVGVEQRIAQIRADWARPGAPAQPNGPGWSTFFDAIGQELQAYRTSADHASRLRSLGRLTRMYQVLQGVGWGPSQQIAAELGTWLRPRNALSWADRRLFDSVGQQPVAADQWRKFGEDLRAAGAQYEGAANVTDRLEAQRKLAGALDSLRQVNGHRPWSPGLEYASALDGLIDGTNLDASIDFATIAPILDRDLVQNEVIYFKGQTSYVTPGPKAGFGLLPSDQGIAFVSSQYSYSTTPIQGFHEQLAADQRGRRAAKMYNFGATSYNTTLATVQVVLTPNGLIVSPNTQSSVDAAFGASPQPGLQPHITRSIAGLIGMNRERILEQVKEGAMPELRAQTAAGSQELSEIRAGQNQAQQNAQLSRFLVGNNTLLIGQYVITELGLSSRPEFARVNGMISSRAPAEQQEGAPFPKPSSLQNIPGGIAVDLHLGSVLGNLAAGYLQSPQAASVQNLMLKITPPPTQGGAPTIERIVNADYPTFLAAVREARAANNGTAVIRVFKPSQPPRFAADAQGRLTGVFRDVTIEVPTPPQAAQGGGLLGPPADVYRITMPTAEAGLEFQFATDPVSGQSRVSGKVAEFTFAPNSAVMALADDENAGRELNLIARSTVLGGLAGQFSGRPFDVPLQTDRLSGIQIQSVSPLDPTGWIRVQLRTTGAPLNLAGN